MSDVGKVMFPEITSLSPLWFILLLAAVAVALFSLLEHRERLRGSAARAQ